MSLHFTWRALLTIVVMAGVLALLAVPATARQRFLERATVVYWMHKNSGSCIVCHTYDEAKGQEPESHNLNEFGKELDNAALMKPLLQTEHDHTFTADENKIIDEVLVALAPLDSDGDGATNREELALGTNPGIKESVPMTAELEKFRKERGNEPLRNAPKK